ncbi:DNA cytosine methyltransferase [Paenirhodobacter populi]|uniref:DNA (cytosine-5-)-methyltransferase n=1 Tax=Paenirhodobacter populi TaxID=2306993 RepID=A0A443J744_9RHOB|nr:DNA cytosine methyltransferase [Sinirhodobacter populi]RWR16359.1 DNA cytosine methyltransferase [Sinirhodobacter populi]
MVLPPRPRNGLSLCAGTGGLDLGIMLAEPGFHTRCWVEWAEYPRDCIIAAQRAGYFAPAPIWDDVTTFDGRPWRGRIDTILAGYPCQPFSMAGRRKGDEDERHLWPDVARIIREVEPEWVFLENVAGHISLGLEAVLRELWEMGWTPACGLFSAGETGATHERQRVFIVAHRDRQQLRPDCGEPDAGSDRRNDTGWSCGAAVEHAPGVGRNARRLPVRAEPPIPCAGLSKFDMADAGGAGPQGREQRGSSGEWHRPPAHGSAAERGRPRLHPPGPADMDGWRSVINVAPDLAPSVSLGDVRRFADHLAAMVAQGNLAEAQAESRICRMASGLASRAHALRALGNGVHPLCAAYAWRSLSSAHGLEPCF